MNNEDMSAIFVALRRDVRIAASQLIASLPVTRFISGNSIHAARDGVSVFLHVGGREGNLCYYAAQLLFADVSVSELGGIEFSLSKIVDGALQEYSRHVSRTGTWAFSLPNDRQEFVLQYRLVEDDATDSESLLGTLPSRQPTVGGQSYSVALGDVTEELAKPEDADNEGIDDEKVGLAKTVRASLQLNVDVFTGAGGAGKSGDELPRNCVAPRHKKIFFRTSDSDRCKHGVVLARVRLSSESATPVGHVLIPVHDLDGEIRGEASVSHLMANHDLTLDSPVAFFDTKDEILKSCNVSELEQLASLPELADKCRTKIQNLINGIRNDNQ